jgi:hypothetical protein
MWKNKEEYFNDLLFGLHNSGTDCFINSSIQLLLRCWDGFEEISKYTSDNKDFFTWLRDSVNNKIWETGIFSESSERLNISLTFIYEFFKFGKKVKETKEQLLKNNNNKITKENAVFVHRELYRTHQNLVSIWRDYGVRVGNDETFYQQADSYDALRLFFNSCLKDVMYVFDKKQMPIEAFHFSGEATTADSFNIQEIQMVYSPVSINVLCNKEKKVNLTIQELKCLWQNDGLKNALLGELPLYYKLFGVCQGAVNYCTSCNFFSCNCAISCIENVHIDDFECWKLDNNVESGSIECQHCHKLGFITRYNFLVPIGKYFFMGNADAATDPFSRNSCLYLESWKDKIYELGEGNFYRNIGVGCHFGSVGEFGGGHYWAYIRSRYLNDLYFECNDSRFPYDNPVWVYTPGRDKHERVYLFEKIDNK